MAGPNLSSQLASSTDAQNVAALLSGQRWTSLELTFTFPTISSWFGPAYSSDEPKNGFAECTPQMKTAIRWALNNQFSAVTNLQFEETNPTSIGPTSLQISFAQSSLPKTAKASFPDEGGDVWFGRTEDYTNPTMGTLAWHTVIHEIGHAVGLKHGHEVWEDRPALTTDRDSMEFSVMTYRSYFRDDTVGYNNDSYSFAQSLMMYDIAALQSLYGANWNTNSGNTTYTFDRLTGEMFVNGTGQAIFDRNGSSSIFMTIWDGGGTDTYDFSTFSEAQSIDLTPGGWSLFSKAHQALLSANGFNPVWARGNVFNALQYSGDPRSLIENAISGSGNDIIIGNAAANMLQGGAGKDTLEGRSGNDTLIGGTGDDRLFGQEGNDSITGSVGNDRLDGGSGNDTFYIDWGDTVEGGADNDLAILAFNRTNSTISLSSGFYIIENGTLRTTLKDVEFVQFAGETTAYGVTSWTTDTLTAMLGGTEVNYAGAQTNKSHFVFGNALANWITGNRLTDSLYGGAGNDTLNSFAGNDRLFGDAGNDNLDGGEGHDTLYGGDGNDTFRLDLGRDVAYGSAGNDTFNSVGFGDEVYGGADTDLVVAAFARNNVTITFSDDVYTFRKGSSNTKIQDVELIRFQNESRPVDISSLITTTVLLSSSQINYWGNSPNRKYLVIGNKLSNTQIHGNSLADTLYGGAGNDGLFGRAGNDSLYGGDGNDTLSGGAGDDTLIAGWGDSLDGGTDNDLAFLDVAGTEFTGSLSDNVYTVRAGNRTMMVTGAVEFVRFAGDSVTYAVTSLGGDIFTPVLNADQSDYTAGYASKKHFITGNGLANKLTGGDLADTLVGGEGNDDLYGGAGDDSLEGSAGMDTLSGDAGNDTLLVGLGDHIDGGAGNDLAIFNFARAGSTATLSGDFYTVRNGDLSVRIRDVELVRFSDESSSSPVATLDTVIVSLDDAQTDYFAGDIKKHFVTGNALPNRLSGGFRDDTLLGGEGNDVLDGLFGNDSLDGQADDDNLKGGFGDNTLIGGFGNDTLIGGVGNDTFIYGDGDLDDDGYPESGDYGNDVIWADAFSFPQKTSAEIDTLILIDVLKEDVQFTRSGSNLWIDILSIGFRIEVRDQFNYTFIPTIDKFYIEDSIYYPHIL